MLRRHPLLAAVIGIVSAAVAALCGVLVASDSSTAPLAFIFVPLYAVGAILVVLLVWHVVRGLRVVRDFAEDHVASERP